VDLFTHVLTAYLLSFGLLGFQPSYLAAGAIAGGLPDGDILLFPISRRFPILRHHGITHSFTGVTIIAVAGAIVGPMISPGNPLVYFGIVWAGGAAHVLEDAFTNFSVPPLLPFSNKRVQFDADRAINFGTLIVSVFAFWLLLGAERNRVEFSVYLATMYALMAFFFAYFALRIALRIHLGRTLTRYGPFELPLATSNPFVWMLISEQKTGGRMTTVYGRYAFLRGLVDGPREVSAPLEADPTVSGPITDRSDAVRRSYPIARRALALLDDSYHFADAEARPEGWAVTWYSLEFAAFGRAAAVRVAFDSVGRSTVKRAWYAPQRRGTV
jgi:membrane-bound metal-dependent hydrolase YbcI (DUF457 family)